jgi:hypothetical protein
MFYRIDGREIYCEVTDRADYEKPQADTVRVTTRGTWAGIWGNVEQCGEIKPERLTPLADNRKDREIAERILRAERRGMDNSQMQYDRLKGAAHAD